MSKKIFLPKAKYFSLLSLFFIFYCSCTRFWSLFFLGLFLYFLSCLFLPLIENKEDKIIFFVVQDVSNFFFLLSLAFSLPLFCSIAIFLMKTAVPPFNFWAKGMTKMLPSSSLLIFSLFKMVPVCVFNAGTPFLFFVFKCFCFLSIFLLMFFLKKENNFSFSKTLVCLLFTLFLFSTMNDLLFGPSFFFMFWDSDFSSSQGSSSNNSMPPSSGGNSSAVLPLAGITLDTNLEDNSYNPCRINGVIYDHSALVPAQSLTISLSSIALNSGVFGSSSLFFGVNSLTQDFNATALVQFILDSGYSGNYDINLYFPRGNFFNSSLVENVNQFILGQRYFIPFAAPSFPPLTFFGNSDEFHLGRTHPRVTPFNP